MTDAMLRRLANHDWNRTLRFAHDRAIDDLRLNADLKDHHMGFALLKHAATVSRIAYPAPPRSSMPTSSMMPDSADDVTQWQLISAYLKGSLTSMPDIPNRPPRPTARDVDMTDLILYIWHNECLMRKGDRSRLKRAVYLKANGVRPEVIRRLSGLPTARLLRAQVEACEDMISAIERFKRK